MHQNEYESDHSITKTNLGLSRSSIGNVTGEIFYYQAEIFYYYALSISQCKSSGEDLQTYCDKRTLSSGKSLSYFCIHLSLSPHALSLNIVCHALSVFYSLVSPSPHVVSHSHSQDNSGALGPIIEMRIQTLFNNLDQLEKEIGSYIDACASIDTFYQVSILLFPSGPCRYQTLLVMSAFC
jgi:hypothetical protein